MRSFATSTPSSRADMAGDLIAQLFVEADAVVIHAEDPEEES